MSVLRAFFVAISCFFVIDIVQAKYPESFVEDGIIVNELKTEEYLDIIELFLPQNPTILEAGCHEGQDTILLGKAWPLGHVYAFEPVKKFVGFTLDELKKHKVSNVTVFPFALSATSGEQKFYYNNQVGAASSLLESSGQDTLMTVNSVNLDEWARDNRVNYIDFMWLDMEGSELSVLRSAPAILKTVKVIITEVNFKEFRKGTTQYRDLYNFLTENGFKLFKIWGSPVWQGTALFIRKELLTSKAP